jgi:hypothetical protein
MLEIDAQKGLRGFRLEVDSGPGRGCDHLLSEDAMHD